MLAAGIIDPAKVTRSALQNAASIAALFLTTEAVVADKPEKAAAPCAATRPAAWAAWTSESRRLSHAQLHHTKGPGLRTGALLRARTRRRASSRSPSGAADPDRAPRGRRVHDLASLGDHHRAALDQPSGRLHAPAPSGRASRRRPPPGGVGRTDRRVDGPRREQVEDRLLSRASVSTAASRSAGCHTAAIAREMTGIWPWPCHPAAIARK